MLKLLKLSLLVMLFAACGPRDVAMDGGNVSGNGKPTVLTASGERPSTCPAKKGDETAVRSPIELDNEVFTGKITASLGAGGQNCFRIGATVNLQNGKAGDVRAKVVITKVEIIPLESLSTTHSLALGMSESAVKTFALAEIEKAKDVFDAKGMVSITYFKYVEGSATGVVIPKGQDLVTVDKQGERPTTCPADFKDSTRLIVTSENNEKVFSKKITAVMDAGDRNCFKIGAEITLNNAKDTPAIAKAKVLKVQIVSKDKLDKTHAAALGVDEKNLKALAEEKIAGVKFDALGLVHITFFELIGEGEPQQPIPVLDEEMFKSMIPQLKEQLTAKLNIVLAKDGVAWEPASLIINYEKAVVLGKIEMEAIKGDMKTSVFPAFRVLFNTKKGNVLSFGNIVDGKRMLVMNNTVEDDDVVDIEGTIISHNKVWAALDDSYMPLGLQLYNETTSKMTGITLGSVFRPFLVKVEEN
ncbi:MAG: hypothetical protein IT287_08550 [Bdellovibrionaceae bacterium]|nr:hypothetical protein [Pseudobdellovibrionaceae bacterium]